MIEQNIFLGDVFAISTAASWAVAVLFFRFSAPYVSTVPFNVFKTVLATLGFAILFAFTGDPWIPDFTPMQWTALVVSSFLGFAVADVTFIASMNRLGAGLGAIVAVLYIPMMVGLAYLFFGEKLGLGAIVGGSLVVVGVILGGIQTGTGGISRRDFVVGLSLGILSELAMSLALMFIRNLFYTHSLLWILCFRFFVGSVFLFLLCLWRGEGAEIRRAFSLNKGLRYTLPASFFGPFLATLLWFLGFRYSLVGRVAIYNQLSTVFIVLLAAVFLNEKLTRRKIAALVFAVSGAILVSVT